jgi:hypothetical protein
LFFRDVSLPNSSVTVKTGTGAHRHAAQNRATARGPRDSAPAFRARPACRGFSIEHRAGKRAIKLRSEGFFISGGKPSQQAQSGGKE